MPLSLGLYTFGMLLTFSNSQEDLWLCAWVLHSLPEIPGNEEPQVALNQQLIRVDVSKKEMATHFRILAWRIPWTGVETGGL